MTILEVMLFHRSENVEMKTTRVKKLRKTKPQTDNILPGTYIIMIESSSLCLYYSVLLSVFSIKFCMIIHDRKLSVFYIGVCFHFFQT
jgi:hypothetical protein